MVLSDSKILEELNNRNIIIEGFNKDNLNPSSVDLTLNGTFKIYKRELKKELLYDDLPQWVKNNNLWFTKYNIGDNIGYYYYDCLDVKNKNQEVETFTIPDEGYVLIPGKVYLYACNEKLGVGNNIRAKVEGKSSLGRLGLFVHVTAGFIDPGFKGSLVLELVATEPIRIYKDMKICQIEYSYLSGEVLESYDKKPNSKYMNQDGVQESLMYKNF